MFKVHTDRTVLLQFGEQPDQVGQRLDAESMRELREAHDNLSAHRFNADIKLNCETEVPDGEDDVLPQPDVQGDNDPLVIPRRAKERDHIKGRSADLIIVDDVGDKPQVAGPVPMGAPKRNPIDIGDYIQLDLI